MPEKIVESCGDIEDFFIRGMELPKDFFIISDIFETNGLPLFNEISGIIITGSRSMITDTHEEIGKTASLLPEAIDKNIPMLGVCFGHQLLAHALGGAVSFNPNGREIGTVKIRLAEKTKNDDLFEVFPEREISVQASHLQSVLKLPKQTEVLAFNSHEAHHAFRVKNKKAWGLQFHPELDADTIKHLIKFYHKQIEQEGLVPEKLSGGCIETQYGKRLLRRFAEIIMQNESM